MNVKINLSRQANLSGVASQALRENVWGEQRLIPFAGCATLPVDYCFGLLAQLVIMIEHDQDTEGGEEGYECKHCASFRF